MRSLRFLPLVAAAAVGCGGAKVGSVSGKITLDGKPLANARVNFQPVGEGKLNPGIGSFGKTDVNGEYTLRLIDDSGPGAIAGKHEVRISAFGEDRNLKPDDDRNRGPADKVPARYNVNTELKFDVRRGDNTANFDLSTKK